MNTTVNFFDVVITGAGPAGSAIALRLVKSGYSVALIEQTDFTKPRIGETLPPEIQACMTELGIWQRFLLLNPIPSYGIQSVWGSVHSETHSHIISPWGKAWHVDRLSFDLMLATSASNAGAVLFNSTKLVACEKNNEGWHLKLLTNDIGKNKKSTLFLQTEIVIDASGRNAILMKWVGAKRSYFDHLVGIGVRYDGIDSMPDNHLIIESCADGWWYSSPVPGNSMVVVLITDGDLCRRFKLANEEVFKNKLSFTTEIKKRIANGVSAGAPHVFNAASHRLRRKEFKESWLAVGDAALAVDPLSGNGVINALNTARMGAKAVLGLLEKQNLNAIEQYENDMDVLCAEYLNERARNYALEQRWLEHAFWQRRIRLI